MSGEYVGRLKRRAMGFLKEAEGAEDSDLAAFFAEQAMQLYVKAIFYEIFGERVRGHELRALLGSFSEYLERHGYAEDAKRVRRFAEEYRRELILAEDAYISARYGEAEFSREDARSLIEVGRRLMELLDEVVGDVELG